MYMHRHRHNDKNRLAITVSVLSVDIITAKRFEYVPFVIKMYIMYSYIKKIDRRHSVNVHW